LISTVNSVIVCGAKINGRIAWKLPSNKTYTDWEAEQLVAAALTEEQLDSSDAFLASNDSTL